MTKKELVMAIQEQEVRGNLTRHEEQELDKLTNSELAELLKDVTAAADKTTANSGGKKKEEESPYADHARLIEKNTQLFEATSKASTPTMLMIGGFTYRIEPKKSIKASMKYQRFFRIDMFDIKVLPR